MTGATSPLPVLASLPVLRDVLAAGRNAILVAAPGAGKTTAVPAALCDEAWLGGRRIVMLEPRRVAARAAARRIAEARNEGVGETVGYRVRLDSKVGPQTRIEIVTEGILTRQLQADPALEGVGLVIFDEFHERSLASDLALALALDVQGALRPDLRLLVMSATLDPGGLTELLGGAAVIEAQGRAFPVATTYLPRRPHDRLETNMASAVARALAETDGGVLAFLPGEAEIRRAVARLSGIGTGIDLLPLYGALPAQDQDRALKPAPAGQRKIVLATTLAESSLTIEGISTVIDSGLKRAPRFDPRTGMTRLETVRVSLASADQRRGRAGRLGPGLCYRLWSEAEERAFAPFDVPEILQADLAPLALELALWGADARALRWRDAPPATALRQACDLLTSLGALDAKGALTPHGRTMAALPLHPRLAHMVAQGKRRGAGGLACDVAALLSDRDLVMGSRDADLSFRLAALRAPRSDAGVHQATRARVLEAARQLRRLAHVTADDESPDPGAVVALAYPDRIAQARGGPGRFRLSGGGGAALDPQDPLAGEDFLAVAVTDGKPADARIFLAAPITRTTIEDLFADSVRVVDEVIWDPRRDAVLARRQTRLGALILDDKPLAEPSPDQIREALLAGLAAKGLGALPWTAEARALQDRVAFLRGLFPDDWPDLSDAALTRTLGDWLAPFLHAVTRLAAITPHHLLEALTASLTFERRRALDQLAPARLVLPSGGSAAIEYAAPGGPTFRVRLQEMFGLTRTPTIAAGRVALRLEFLSPAGRAIGISGDLEGFWKTGYPAIRAELRGRYPKHAWPEDPANATPARPGRPR